MISVRKVAHLISVGKGVPEKRVLNNCLPESRETDVVQVHAYGRLLASVGRNIVSELCLVRDVGQWV